MNNQSFQAGRTIDETLHLLGYKEFHTGQEEAINHLLAGRSAVVVLPTGSGKSLIYQIAALHLPGVTLVISPLIALMQDQVDSLQEQGIAATFINSSLSTEEQNERLERMVDGEYRIVYVTPERLRQCLFYERIQELDVSLLAVDEAHSISEWGHDFRPDYLHIAEFRQAVGNPVTVAVTATATRRVQQEIIDLLQLADARRVLSGTDRPNIKFFVRTISGEEKAGDLKLAAVDDIFRERKAEPAIVYVGTRNEAELVADYLREELEVNARHYHAGVSNGQRSTVQDAFLNGELPVVAATNAFGMGIDRSDVRLVLHYSMPGSIESYYQEAGRAGRDGKPAEAILLYHRDDRQLHEHFIRQSEISYYELERLYEQLLAVQAEQNETPDRVRANIQELARKAQLREVRVGLERLEEAGVMEQGLYDGNELEVTLLNWDEQAVREIVERIETFGNRQREQLEEMVRYAENELHCRRAELLKHFGDAPPDEVRRDCCDICEGKREVAEFVAEIEEEAEETEPPTPPAPLTDTIVECVRAFEGLRTPQQMVDLLHGDEKGHNRFRDSKYNAVLEAYSREAIQREVERLLEEQVLMVNELERLSRGGERPVEQTS